MSARITGIAALLSIALLSVWLLSIALLSVWLVSLAQHEGEKYDACWGAGGVQVKTVKFSNGTVCIDRSTVLQVKP